MATIKRKAKRGPGRPKDPNSVRSQRERRRLEREKAGRLVRRLSGKAKSAAKRKAAQEKRELLVRAEAAAFADTMNARGVSVEQVRDLLANPLTFKTPDFVPPASVEGEASNRINERAIDRAVRKHDEALHAVVAATAAGLPKEVAQQAQPAPSSFFYADKREQLLEAFVLWEADRRLGHCAPIEESDEGTLFESAERQLQAFFHYAAAAGCIGG